MQPRSLRLSWPKAGDRRRSRVGKSPAAGSQHQKDNTHIIHVSYRDMQMHYHFNSPVAVSVAPPILAPPLLWNPANLNTGEQELLHHFQTAASRSLTVFGHNPQELGNTIIRITLASNSPAATAVLRSLLALSALQRDGVHIHAAELKISAPRALAALSPPSLLSASSSSSPSHSALSAEPIEATCMQHVAAGMLLLSIEVHQSSCTSEDWTRYLAMVKDVIQAAGLLELGHKNADLALLLDWVYYHDVLARFSLRHWHTGWAKGTPTYRAKLPQPQPGALVSPKMALLELLSEVCDAVSASRQNRFPDNHEYNNALLILDWRIRTLNLFPNNSSNKMEIDETEQESNLITELYQLSTLIYLARSSENLLSSTTTSKPSKNGNINNRTKVQDYINKGFSLLAEVKSCPRQFPIFILGAEAHSDQHRVLILDVISRTEKEAESRSFNHVRLLLQAIWAQYDLGAGGGPAMQGTGQWGYWDKMSYMISCCSVLPTFV
ncbi:fungal-specific transcription factor domain-containing protein [Cladorrhinum sp. PSN259]|nr:fungal-specific transcription factor domain-containing protein [Cladorrhinum sp. PSN259]